MLFELYVPWQNEVAIRVACFTCGLVLGATALALALGATTFLLEWTEQESASTDESIFEADGTEADLAEAALAEEESAVALRADLAEAEDWDNYNRDLDTAAGEYAAELWQDHELDRFLEEAQQWELNNSIPHEWKPW
jgi:hypothetical protein